MRKIITTTWVTLDGFIAGPDGEMDWVGEVYDQAMGTYEYDLVSAADTLLLGRVTYESFAGAWPFVPDKPDADPGEVAYARKLNAMRKIVFSKTLPSVEWNNSTLMREIVPDVIEKLKQEPGRDMEAAQRFFKQALVVCRSYLGTGNNRWPWLLPRSVRETLGNNVQPRTNI